MSFVSDGCLELTGYPSADLLQNRKIAYGQLIHPDDAERVFEHIQSAMSTHKPFELVYRIITFEMNEKWVRDLGRGVWDSQNNLIALEGFITDITQQKQNETEIKNQQQLFRALRTIDIAISSSFDLRLTSNIMLEQIMDQLKVDAAALLRFHPSQGLLQYSSARGFQNKNWELSNLRVTEGLAGIAAVSRKVVHIPDLRTSVEATHIPAYVKEENFITYVGVPLIAKGQVRGVLEVFNRNFKAVDKNWLGFLDILAGQAAIAIDNAILFEDLQRSNFELTIAYDVTLENWVKTIELRDWASAGHTQRVIDKTIQLARIVGIDSNSLVNFRRGALLHDIGMMNVPDAILVKPQPLTNAEWEIVRQHPTYAYKLLSTISYLRAAIDIPYNHHEKWDGSGYPRGLKGEEIPIAARIFAVVDVWDTLTSPRPFRPAWTIEQTQDYINHQSGKHFDPEIVRAYNSAN